MSTDYSQQRCPSELVVTLTGVSVAISPPHDVGLDNVSLSVKRGELALILLEHGLWDHALTDVVSGLSPVDSGTISVFGDAWTDMSPDRQALARGKIGRVFELRGWMSNLDIDENITLAQRHHTKRPETEILAEARSLARMVNLNEIPVARPAAVGREELRRAEWVRAALGSPWLVLLERPGRDLARGWRPLCARLVEHLRGQGAAVIWLCEDEDEWNDKSLNPSLKLRAEGNTLRADRTS